MGRRSEIAAAQAEFQKVNQSNADKKKARDTSNTPVTPTTFTTAEAYLWGQAVALWNAYYRYVLLYLAVVAGVMLVLIRRDQ